MVDSVLTFYDNLAQDYHLLFKDWPTAVRWQGDLLNDLIRAQLGRTSPLAALDCSCGIGTQALGLALQGYDVYGTDLSPASIDRARTEARFFDVEATFDVADFRNLQAEVAGTYDVVISCDNSLPHLQSEQEILNTLAGMRSKLSSEGIALISIRDYDKLLEERPESTPVRVITDDDGKRAVFQVWNWHPDDASYIIHHFIIRQTTDDWRTIHQATAYKALRRHDLTRLLEESGFRDVVWKLPDETGYYQPIVIARR